MMIEIVKRVRYKGGWVLEPGLYEAVDSHMVPTLDKARSHPKVWGEYVWVDTLHYTVAWDGDLYSVPATHAREVRGD